MRHLFLCALLCGACAGPIGVGTEANLTETVCVVPSANLTVEDEAAAAGVWHDASNGRVNMRVVDTGTVDAAECDTVVSEHALPVFCGQTREDGAVVWLDTDKPGCDPLAVLPHELGHLLTGTEHSPDPLDLMYYAAAVRGPTAADLARLPN